ncbi:MAG: adventurous gliding motility protein GltC [Myxococcaceae bacterium]|nr:adventurous gliding motility protein GltC [Myxococcaceae bacterium]
MRSLLVAVALAVAAPVTAHAQFEGLDLSGETAKSKKTKRSTKKRTTKRTRAKKPPVAAEPVEADADDETSEAASSAPASTPAAAPASLPAMPPPPAPAAKPATAQSGMNFDALDVSTTTADRQRIEIALGLFKNQQYEQAAMAGQEILNDRKLLGLHPEAQFLIAKSLYRMELYHASLGEFSRVLARGPATKFFKSSLEWLFFISRKTTSETVILDEIAKYANHDFPEKYRNEFRYLLARYHFVRGRALDQVGQKAEADRSFEEVKKVALLIPRTDPFFARAKYMEGLAHFRDGEVGEAQGAASQAAFQASVESMKEVVRLTRANGGPNVRPSKADQSLRELAFMQLARTHYGHRQNRYALFYYKKMERGAPQWLESLFEASWADYRVGQHEQALGNLITLSSPFFREEYFPESLILKAVIYYENCRYPEAIRIVNEFERFYQPVHDELEMLSAKPLDAAQYYGVLADVQKKNRATTQRSRTDIILERILRLALTDQDLKKVNDSILELESEVDHFGEKADTFKYSELSKRLIDDLKVQRTSLVDKAGIMAKGKLQREMVELKQLLANGERIKFETTTKEKEFLEEQLKEGGRTTILKNYRYSVAVDDDELYWPYEGEYWRDELGTYQYTMTKGCVDRDKANRTVKTAGTL